MKKVMISGLVCFLLFASFVSAAFTDAAALAYQQQGKPRIMSYVSSKPELQSALGAYNMVEAITKDPVAYGQDTAMQFACGGGVSEMRDACNGLSTAKTVYSTVSSASSASALQLACGTGGSLVGSLGEVCSQWDSIYGQAQQVASAVSDPKKSAEDLANQQLSVLKQQLMLFATEKLLPGEAKKVMGYAQQGKLYLDAFAKPPTSDAQKNVKKPATPQPSSASGITGKAVADSQSGFNIQRSFLKAGYCSVGVNFDLSAKDAASGVGVGDISECYIDTKGTATVSGKYSEPTAYFGKGFLMADKPAPFKNNFVSVDGMVMLYRLNGYLSVVAAGKDTIIRSYPYGWLEDKESSTRRDVEVHSLMGNSYLIFNNSILFEADITVDEPFAFVSYGSDGVKVGSSSASSASKSANIRLDGVVYSVPFGSRVTFKEGKATVDMRYVSNKEFEILEDDGSGGLKKVAVVRQLPGSDVKVSKDALGGYLVEGDGEFISSQGGSFEVHGAMVYRADNDFSVLGALSAGGGVVVYKKGNEGFMVVGQEGWTWVTQCGSIKPDASSQHVDYCKKADTISIRAGADKSAVSIAPIREISAKDGEGIIEVMLKWRQLCELNQKNNRLTRFKCDEIKPDVSGESFIVPGLTYSVMPGKKFEAVITKDEKRVSGEAELTMALSSGRISVRDGKMFGNGAFSELLIDGRTLKVVDSAIVLEPVKQSEPLNKSAKVGFAEPSASMCSSRSVMAGTGNVVAVTGMQAASGSGCVGTCSSEICSKIVVRVKGWYWKDVLVNSAVSYEKDSNCIYNRALNSYGCRKDIGYVLIKADTGEIGYQGYWLDYQGCGKYVSSEALGLLYKWESAKQAGVTPPAAPPRIPTLAEEGSLGAGNCRCEANRVGYPACSGGKVVPGCVTVLRATGGWLCNSGNCVGVRVNLVACADGSTLACLDDK